MVQFTLVVLLSRKIITRNILAYTPVEFNFLETLAKTFINPARQNQLFQENILNNAPARRIAVAMNTNSAFSGSFTESPFWCQQSNLRQIRILRGGQPIVDFEAADNCRFYVTTIKAMNFHDDIPSFAINNSKTTMYFCLISLRCKKLIKLVITHN